MSNPHYNIHGVYSSPSPSKKQVNRGTRTSSFDSPPTQPERNTGGNTGWRDEKDDSGIDMSVINAAKKRNQDLAYKSSLIQQQKMSDALNLSRSLQKSNISKSSWERMMDKGSLSPEVALQMGLAKQLPDGRIIDPATGKGWVPKGQLSKDMIGGMQDLQFMQDEGVYGGVSGAEKVMNDLKKQLQSASTDKEYRDQFGKPVLDDEGNPISEYDHATAALNRLSGQRDEQGNFILDDKGNPIAGNTAWMYDDPKYWDDKTKAKMESIGLWSEEGGSALGYDPTAAYTFSEIEDSAKYGKNDPRNLYQNKFLQRGTLWDDPLSGTLAPARTAYGGGSGGGGWGGYGGYGGGGSGGGYGAAGQNPLERGYQRGQVGPGNLQEQVNQIYLGMSGVGMQKKRGGIVSLLGLR